MRSSSKGRGGPLSVSGTASLVRDRERIHELWNPVAGAWFPEGPDTPSVFQDHTPQKSAQAAGGH